jgi:hypothetical protein
MNTLEKLLSDIETEKSNLEMRAEKLRNLPIEELEAAFPEGSFSHFIGNTYSFILPLRFELIEQFKKFVATKEGWDLWGERQHVWGEKSGGIFMYLRVNGSSILDIDFRTEKTGTTCIIQQIGFEQKPVFELICGDGAKENTFGAA